MKKIILFTLMIFAMKLGFSQTLSPELISSTGDFFNSGGTSLSWSLGEPFTEFLEKESTLLSQGFQQTNYIISELTTGKESYKKLSVQIYPNPATRDVNIRLISSKQINYQIQLFDISGKQLLSKITYSSIIDEKIGLQDYESGIFILSVIDLDNQVVEKFKISKQ